MFQLSKEKLENWKSQIVISNPAAKTGVRNLPYAFTEQGVVASMFLRSFYRHHRQNGIRELTSCQ